MLALILGSLIREGRIGKITVTENKAAITKYYAVKRLNN